MQAGDRNSLKNQGTSGRNRFFSTSDNLSVASSSTGMEEECLRLRTPIPLISGDDRTSLIPKTSQNIFVRRAKQQLFMQADGELHQNDDPYFNADHELMSYGANGNPANLFNLLFLLPTELLSPNKVNNSSVGNYLKLGEQAALSATCHPLYNLLQKRINGTGAIKIAKVMFDLDYEKLKKLVNQAPHLMFQAIKLTMIDGKIIYKNIIEIAFFRGDVKSQSILLGAITTPELLFKFKEMLSNPVLKIDLQPLIKSYQELLDCLANYANRNLTPPKKRIHELLIQIGAKQKKILPYFLLTQFTTSINLSNEVLDPKELSTEGVGIKHVLFNVVQMHEPIGKGQSRHRLKKGLLALQGDEAFLQNLLCTCSMDLQAIKLYYARRDKEIEALRENRNNFRQVRDSSEAAEPRISLMEEIAKLNPFRK